MVKKAVEKQDFLDAVDRIVGGLEKKNKIITPGEKKGGKPFMKLAMQLLVGY